MAIAEDIQTDDTRAEDEFARELMEYAGRWVAIIDHAVVVDTVTLDELLERLDKRQAATARVLRVPKHPQAACFY